MTTRQLLHPSPITIPDSLRIRREPPRPPEFRPVDYMDQFDDTTIAYDVFEQGGSVWLVGPPLRNLEDAVADSLWRAGKNKATKYNILNRTFEARIPVDAKQRKNLTITLDDCELPVSISPSGQSLFKGRNVLMTKSKNNHPQWIADWASFHAQEHGVDAILLYDNGSTDYDTDTLLEAIDQSGIEVAVVVDWPFKWGPRGGRLDGGFPYPWDSDFSEYGLMAHARRRFLEKARHVLHQDIDELMLTDDGRSVFDHVDQSPDGYVCYSGRWIESVPLAEDADPDNPVFDDFGYYRPSQKPSSTKWALDPKRTKQARQWKQTEVIGVMPCEDATITHRRFRAISPHQGPSRYESTAHPMLEDSPRNANVFIIRNAAADHDPQTHTLDKRLILSRNGIDPQSERLEVKFWRNVGMLKQVNPEMTRQELIALLKELILPERRFANHIRETSIKNDIILVMDCVVQDRVQLNFEIAAKSDQTDLSVTVEDDATWDVIKTALQGLGTPANDGSKQLRFSTWTTTDDPDVISGDALVLMELVFVVLEFALQAAETA